MTARERCLAIAVPWTVTVAFGLLYAQLLLPRLMQGGLGALFAAFAGLVLVSFAAAAITFTVDILRGRDPTR